MKIDDIHSYLRQVKHVNLATVEENKPRVRTMNFVEHNKQYWMVSYGKDAKVHQIQENPEFEFCVTISEIVNDRESFGSIRVRGRAKIIDDLSIKEEIKTSVWFFDRFFTGVEDTNYVPIQLDFSKIISQCPKDKQYYQFDMKN